MLCIALGNGLMSVYLLTVTFNRTTPNVQAVTSDSILLQVNSQEDQATDPENLPYDTITLKHMISRFVIEDFPAAPAAKSLSV